MSTTASVITAARDNDIRERLIAAAAMQGIDSPQAWVEARLHELAAAPVDGGSTVASVHEYAVASYTPTPRPGQDPTKVTDAHLAHAVQHLKETP